MKITKRRLKGENVAPRADTRTIHVARRGNVRVRHDPCLLRRPRFSPSQMIGLKKRWLCTRRSGVSSCLTDVVSLTSIPMCYNKLSPTMVMAMAMAMAVSHGHGGRHCVIAATAIAIAADSKCKIFLLHSHLLLLLLPSYHFLSYCSTRL